MKYDTFISYSINDSSVAYELSGLLSNQKLTYYLDCVESGVITNEYTKGKVAECSVYIVIPNIDKHNEYATAMMDYALSMGKPVAVLAAEGKNLPEAVAAQPTFGSLKELAEGVAKLMETAAAIQSEHTDNAPSAEADAPSAEMPSTDAPSVEMPSTDAATIPNIQAGSLDDEADTRTWVEVPDTVQASSTEGYREYKGSEEEFYKEAEKYVKSGHKYKAEKAPTVTATMSSEEPKKKEEKGCLLGQIFTILFMACFIFFSIKSCIDDQGSVIDASTENLESDIQRAKELTEMGKTLMAARHKNEAAEYLLEAAEMGNVHAMYYVGVCYKNVEQKEHVAANWLYRAAREGVKAGFTELAGMAKRDVSIAQVHLGTCYFYGYGTKRNRESAVYWYTQAAKLKNPQGYFNLAICYEHGEGVKKDREEALRLYRQAEKLGHKQSAREARRLYDDLYNDD